MATLAHEAHVRAQNRRASLEPGNDINAQLAVAAVAPPHQRS